ncbi:hypothetical protein PR048_020221, partial [Dryococelus australis]
MGGEDLADRLRALYCVDRKARKWWHRLLFGLLDIAFFNYFVIYNTMFEPVSVLEFHRSVVCKVMSVRKLLPLQGKEGGSQKRRKSGYSVTKDVRLANRGIHWPRFTEKRGRCEVCSVNKIESRPYSQYSHCKLHLCCNDRENCFALYHDV